MTLIFLKIKFPLSDADSLERASDSTIPTTCNVISGRVGLDVLIKTKGSVTDINECVEMCNDMADCEFWSFYEANWLKRRRCILYGLEATRKEMSMKWSSGETNC